jgi:TRAP-type mannitol/chloroaromatic compound transport system permease small subunit
MNERSAYESGLPAVYLLKGTLLVFAVLVGVQALSIALRSVIVLFGRAPAPRPQGLPEEV